MSCVDKITYIKGTDRTFTLRAVYEVSREPKDLQAFVGASGDGISLKLQGESGPIMINLDSSSEGILEVENNSAGLAGKVKVVIADSSSLKVGKNQNMELIISEGAGPDFNVSIIQFEKSLEVKERLF